MTKGMVEIEERPILFNGPMVRAILEGRKTQTRRVVKPKPPKLYSTADVVPITNGLLWAFSRIGPKGERCTWPPGPTLGMLPPFGKPGDRLWVRETWRVRGGEEYEYQRHQPSVVYRADTEDVCGWKPSIFMPRGASRITLEVTGVRVERLLQSREADAKAEGFHGGHNSIPGYKLSATPIEQFSHLWDSINAKRGFGWAKNPWVWVIDFRKTEEK